MDYCSGEIDIQQRLERLELAMPRPRLLVLTDYEKLPETGPTLLESAATSLARELEQLLHGCRTVVLRPSLCWERLFFYQEDSLRKVAERILRSSHDAEDVMQDTYVKATTFSKTQPTTSNPAGYLRTVVRNACIDKLRERWRARNMPIESAETQTQLGAIHDPAAELERDELKKKLRDAIQNHLPKALAEPLLRCANGEQTAEIAESMGVTRQAVYNRVFRAKRILARVLSTSWTNALLLAVSVCTTWWAFVATSPAFRVIFRWASVTSIVLLAYDLGGRMVRKQSARASAAKS